MYHSIQELQDQRDLDVMQYPYKNRNDGTATEESSTVTRLKFPQEKKSANKYVLVPHTK